MDRLPVKVAVLAAMLLGLPLLGVWLAGLPLSRYLAFPPVGRYVSHAPFSWAAFFLYLLLIAAAVGPLAVRGVRAALRMEKPAPPARRFPGWGWTGLFALAVFWVLAWTRFSWFSPLQPHTFFPLWLSFVAVVNALDVKISGDSLMTARPGFFLALFPASAGFWWFFEYLNRFVLNWFYSGAAYGPWSYFLLASMSFSTVLPAVLSTRRLLRHLPRLTAGFAGFIVLRPRHPKSTAAAMLAVAGTGLLLIGVFPNLLFPLLWISPLLIIVSLRTLSGQRHTLSALADGDWRPVVTAAAAALVCGFFWEMWNFFSLARWTYQVPYVHRFTVFEMPVLGYAGYLPFGLECAMAGQLLEDLIDACRRGNSARPWRTQAP
ncbi:MAG: hypothetical protein PVG78_13895 [Desulfobacterales bacterium]